MISVSEQEAGEKAWNSLNEYISHGDADDKVDACRQDLKTMQWSEMQEIAPEAGVDLSDNPTKTELRHRLAEALVFTDGPTGDGKVFQTNDGTFKQIGLLEQQNDSTPTMSDDNDDTTVEAEEGLAGHAYGDLMNLARSAREQFDEVEIDTNAPKKGELIESLEEYSPEGSREEGWTIEVDGSREEVDLLDVQTPDSQSTSASGPTDATILYCLTRAETTPERVEEIREALEGNSDYELREAGGGDKYSIVLPAEEQEGYEEAQEDEEEEETEETAESEDESDSSEAEEEEPEETEESESADSDEAEGDSEEEESEEEAEDEEESEEESDDNDQDKISADLIRDRWDENKGKDELYSMAVEDDIEGRSDMSKSELIEALIEERDQIVEE